ncbi:helix-turn-helix domain-containing protein [Nonomuraea sp. NBC_00507]|uniref:PucR family transcriptional regulator n=1 Tax=Nonomuraea sp. NBC_00507 TaxID=2976002 RepID=UPI002E19A5A1
MASALQRLIDSLGDRLGRSVAIDDPGIRLLAYSSHAGGFDSARLESIMRRRVSDAIVTYVHGLGLLESRDLVMVPARPDLGLDADRMVMPIRHEDKLLGFLWLLLTDGPVTDAHVRAVRQAGEQAALIMHREYLLGELSRGRQRELARDLLSDDSDLRADAAGRLIEEELVVAGYVTALMVTVTHTMDEPLAERDRLALAAGLDRGRRRLAPGNGIQLARPDHGILIVVHAGRPVPGDMEELAEAIREQVIAESGRARDECWIGIGEPRSALVSAYESYREARAATNVARVVRVLGPVVRYSRLGVYGLLAELPPNRLARSLHPGLRALLDHDGGNEGLVRTLETFLDNAGDVKRTSEHLRIHRASLYYRLRRIEEIAGIRLSSGDDRLAVHLALKVARLIELH